METNSKYLLRLELHHQLSNKIKNIFKKLKINATNAIIGELLNFYQELYVRKKIYKTKKNESYLSQINEIP